MSEPYLIAHVVRGSPAFDIAEQMEVHGEVWWIIPTSGHRAYPYWEKPLSELGVDRGPDWQWAWGWNNETGSCEGLIPIPAEDHPDHYALSAAPRGQGLIKNLAERLGLVPKPPTITRR